MGGSSGSADLDSSFIDRVHLKSLLRRGLIDESTMTDLENRKKSVPRKKVMMHLKS